MRRRRRGGRERERERGPGASPARKFLGITKKALLREAGTLDEVVN